MQEAPSLAEMRAQTARLAAWGPGARVFGRLWCQGCGCSRLFTSNDAHVQHITDASCEACGFVYGRIDEPDVRRGELGPDGKVTEVFRAGRKRQPVISDATAAKVAAEYRKERAQPAAPVSPEPRPMPTMPAENDATDGSRVSSWKRSLNR